MRSRRIAREGARARSGTAITSYTSSRRRRLCAACRWRGRTLETVGTMAGAPGVGGRRIDRGGRTSGIGACVWRLERSSTPVCRGSGLWRILMLRTLTIRTTIRVVTSILRLMRRLITWGRGVRIGQLGGVCGWCATGKRIVAWHLGRDKVFACAGAGTAAALTGMLR